METLKRLPMINNSWPMLLNNLFNRDSFNEGNLNFFDQNNAITPAVNIKETTENFAIELLAPGMSKTDFKVEVDKNQLTISAQKQSQSETDLDNYHRKEFSFESLRRTFTLPENIVDVDKINAQYTDGILYLNIPKKQKLCLNRLSLLKFLNEEKHYNKRAFGPLVYLKMLLNDFLPLLCQFEFFLRINRNNIIIIGVVKKH